VFLDRLRTATAQPAIGQQPVTGPLAVARIGLGLAAVGRPAYINLGHRHDLPPERSVAALRSRAHELLASAYAQGVRYVDVARSYGRAEEFLAGWLGPGRDYRPDVVVGSKWGYTYAAGWRVDVEVHETKDHSVATFDRQLAETRALLGERLDLYQIHSVTPDSTALVDAGLHRRLAALAAEGVTVGLSTSGPYQSEAIRAALRVRLDGQPVFASVQATWNLLEPSVAGALAEAHDAGSPPRCTSPGRMWCCPAPVRPPNSPAICGRRPWSWTSGNSRGWPAWPNRPHSTGDTDPVSPGPEGGRSSPASHVYTIGGDQTRVAWTLVASASSTSWLNWSMSATGAPSAARS
jgi:aryl-alcohol dehydrogenase-like predicted oxidoreductase